MAGAGATERGMAGGGTTSGGTTGDGWGRDGAIESTATVCCAGGMAGAGDLAGILEIEAPSPRMPNGPMISSGTSTVFRA